jgi:hypothetical protein
MDLIASIGELLLSFVLGLIEGVLGPLFESIFGAPSEE